MNILLACDVENWLHRRASVAQARRPVVERMGARGIEAWESQWQRVVEAAEGPEFEKRGAIAIIRCVGMLDYKYDIWAFLFDASCYTGIANKVAAAAADRSVNKIVLYCDSPGGYTQGVIEASNAIYDAGLQKEVVAVVDPSAYSGGYWLASQASRIVAIESGGVGSIGSQVIYSSQYRMLREIGLDAEVVRAAVSPDKNVGHPVEEISDAGREDRQALVDWIGQRFVEHVARGRGTSEEQVLETFGKGRIFYSPEAMRRGMIDEIGSFAAELSS